MNDILNTTIALFNANNISADRQKVLQPLVEYILAKKTNNQPTALNFICTHNSRRSHLAQIWAQAMASYFSIKNIYCYSGGTEATALFSMIATVLQEQGFTISKLSLEPNPIFAIKHAENEMASICFSKKYNDAFNPKNNYCAIPTCNSANETCPIIIGAESRIPIMYIDPKEFDNTPQQMEMYTKRSLEIGEEMWWVFNNVASKKLI